MPTCIADGIPTHYEVVGSGLPLLMFAPGGFGATAANWSSLGIHARIRLVDHLSGSYTCILFDRREAGRSGGRLETITWERCARQGLGVLDHLGIDRAFLVGACVGCSIALTLAADQPDRVLGAVLYSPAGGPRYRLRNRRRFDEHLDFLAQAGLAGVRDLAQGADVGFSQDPRVGPWGHLVWQDPSFADEFGAQQQVAYEGLVTSTAWSLFDRDTVPGPDAEVLMSLDLPALVVAGDDDSHAPSAAHYLRECLSGARLWDVPVVEQDGRTAPARVRAFLDDVLGRDSTAPVSPQG